MHKFILLVVSLLLPCVVRAQTLGVALNATNLTWTTSRTGGSSGWYVENSTTHDGVSVPCGWSSCPFSTFSLLMIISSPPFSISSLRIHSSPLAGPN